MNAISILLVEDHAVVREGLRGLLEMGGCTVVGEAASGADAVRLARECRPDVTIMDVVMPGLNGCEATRRILAHDRSARVLALSAHSEDEYVDRLIRVGARGFIAKECSGAQLLSAVRAIAAGRSYFSPAIARRLRRDQRSRAANGRVFVEATDGLSSRETEVLQLVAEGAANKQIAGRLGISIKTVQKHRQRLMDKLDIHETAGLTRYAIASGAVDGGSWGTRPRRARDRRDRETR